MTVAVDLMLTPICNLHCPFCYGPDPQMLETLRTSEWNQLVEFFRSRGVTEYVIAGGEPTLSPSLKPVVTQLREMGAWVALQTNATRSAMVRDLSSLVDVISVPIDALSVVGAEAMRSAAGVTDKALSLIQAIREAGKRTQIRVGTVVTHLNVDELPQIADAVRAVRPDLWKLYEFRPRGAGRLASDLISGSAAAWKQACAFIETQDFEFEVHMSPRSASVGAYLIVNPDSRLLIPQDSDYLEFGLLLKDGRVDESVWLAAVSSVDAEAHAHNMDRSFPSAFVSKISSVGHESPLITTRMAEPRRWLDREGR